MTWSWNPAQLRPCSVFGIRHRRMWEVRPSTSRMAAHPVDCSSSHFFVWTASNGVASCVQVTKRPYHRSGRILTSTGSAVARPSGGGKSSPNSNMTSGFEATAISRTSIIAIASGVITNYWSLRTLRCNISPPRKRGSQLHNGEMPGDQSQIFPPKTRSHVRPFVLLGDPWPDDRQYWRRNPVKKSWFVCPILGQFCGIGPIQFCALATDRYSFKGLKPGPRFEIIRRMNDNHSPAELSGEFRM